MVKKNIYDSKIALTIPTGRTRSKESVQSFLKNAESFGYDLKNISIYLSIDTDYQSTSISDFKLPSGIEEKVSKVEYISKKERDLIGREIANNFENNQGLIYNSFAGRGYSNQRNSALLRALQDNNDFSICFDDDESPIIPVKKEDGTVYWKEMDFFTPHLKALSSGTDVTRGPYMGYISPIPSDFERDIPEVIRRKLGEALQLGNDVITGYSFFNLMNKIKHLPEREIETPSRPFVVENGRNGKHIYAGNMGINLQSLREGRIPLFYTPVGARGEDTIFALQLKNTEVKEVDSYIFHDPFNMYPGIFQGEFPENLKNIPVTSSTKERFANALEGWLKYAPILINMTSKDEEEIAFRTNEMLEKIQEPTVQLAELFDSPRFAQSKEVLQNYFNTVEEDFSNLNSVQLMWRQYLNRLK